MKRAHPRACPLRVAATPLAGGNTSGLAKPAPRAISAHPRACPLRVAATPLAGGNTSGLAKPVPRYFSNKPAICKPTHAGDFV